jgi:hypothetical protein
LACCRDGRPPGPPKASDKFIVGQSELDVATYTDEGNKIALLGIAGTKRISMAFSKQEWVPLINLWTKAKNTQSAAWTVIGTMKETGTEDPSRLTMSAGPGVRFAISTPKKGTMIYTLPTADAARFERALLGVKDYLSK